ncbi:hypothetical protein J7L29_02640 [Candidatus Bathyarchaeota archaeon]|nr:hypothetical protein [Candidatus Bathyarchaeota archaeon]
MRKRAQIAVATVSGKAYYKLVNELKNRNILFLSLVPGDPIPPWIKVVITTEKERSLIEHDRVLTYDAEADPSSVVGEALRISMSKEIYEELVIGIDPGKTFGVAVLADGRILKTSEGLTMEKTIEMVLDELRNNPSKNKIIRVGRGVPEIAEKIVKRLERVLPKKVSIEMVDEGGTSTLKNAGSKRKLSDSEAAVRIASKKGEPT